MGHSCCGYAVQAGKEVIHQQTRFALQCHLDITPSVGTMTTLLLLSGCERDLAMQQLKCYGKCAGIRMSYTEQQASLWTPSYRSCCLPGLTWVEVLPAEGPVLPSQMMRNTWIRSTAVTEITNQCKDIARVTCTILLVSSCRIITSRGCTLIKESLTPSGCLQHKGSGASLRHDG